MQERTHAFAMKSQIWLLDPRPQLPAIVRAVEQGFELSEASHTPVMLMLRIRACHVFGRFTAQDNRRPAFSAADALAAPVRDYGRIILPPSTYAQEREKVEARLPAALRFIAARGLNETSTVTSPDIGIVLQGGLYNSTLRALELLGCADVFGTSRVPLYVLNVTYPLVSRGVAALLRRQARGAGHRGGPAGIHRAGRQPDPAPAGLATRVLGKEVLPMCGEYTRRRTAQGDRGVPRARGRGCGHAAERRRRAADVSPQTAAKLAALVPARPSGLCTGCPERPFFAAMKILQKETGPAAHQRRHRLPFLRDPATVQHGQQHHGLWAGRRGGLGLRQRRRQARGVGHGRRWLLAQRTHQRHRQRGLQPAGSTSPSSSTTATPPRPAARTSSPRARPARTARAIIRSWTRSRAIGVRWVQSHPHLRHAPARSRCCARR